jgi:antibiotic biosynthesis monooxygenase (ABM) superfamily enzyme
MAVTGELPSSVGSAIGVTASVVLITWILMPVLSWIFRSWLYPTSQAIAILQANKM